MYTKVTTMMFIGMVLVGSAIGDGDDRFPRQGPIRQILRPLLGGRPIFQQGGRQPLFGGRQPFLGGGGAPVQGGGALPVQGGGLGNANAAGLGSGTVQNNQAIGTGTGIANVGPGGFGIGLGVGAAVATPIGNFALGEGQSLSFGK